MQSDYPGVVAAIAYFRSTTQSHRIRIAFIASTVAHSKPEPAMPRTPAELYAAMLTERYREFKALYYEFLKVFPSSHVDQKLKMCGESKAALKTLKGNLPSEYVPIWISEVESLLDAFEKTQGSQVNSNLDWINRLIATKPLLDNEDWAFVNDSHPGAMDFEAVFRAKFDASEMPRLFDELIASVQAMIDSDQVPTMVARRALEKLLASLKKNRKAGWLSAVCTREFCRDMGSNLIVELAESIPVIAPFAKAFMKTFGQYDVSLNEVMNQTLGEISREIMVELKAIDAEPKQLSLPAPTAVIVVEAN